MVVYLKHAKWIEAFDKAVLYQYIFNFMKKKIIKNNT